MELLRKIINSAIALSVAFFLGSGSASAIELIQETNAVKYSFEVSVNGRV